MGVDEPRQEENGKELEKNLEAFGNALLSPPSSAEHLLSLLFELEECLIGVNQSPLNCVQRAMNPAMKALTSQKLLYHLDVHVKVSVASCISETLRITAPDAPYGDEQMKEIFNLIVAAFDNISDISSCYYQRRVKILETFARIRLWVVMVDLECNSSILQMFKQFVANIRKDHPDAVFMYMGFIMIMVLDEIDEIPSELLSPLLDCVRKGNQNVLPVARKLGFRVIENSILKLVPYMNQAVQYTGFSLEDYEEIVACICEQMPFENSHYEALASRDISTGNCVKKSYNQGMQWSGRTKRGRGTTIGKNDLNGQLSAEASLAPNEDEHFDKNLTGSRIKVVCSKEQKSCEGDIVSCDPLEKKQKVHDAGCSERTLIVKKEECEFVEDESIACEGKLPNLPILHNSCQQREETSVKNFDDKGPNSGGGQNSENVENETGKDVGNVDNNSATESKNETNQSCSILRKSNGDDRKLQEEFLKPKTIKESEDKKEGISNLLIELT